MQVVPAYPKILTLGAAYTQAALDGEVVVQEKVDGSQFGWGINEDGDLVFRSKGVAILSDGRETDSLFAPAVEHLRSVYARRLIEGHRLRSDSYFYAEAIAKPKHNVLQYASTPRGHAVLFDALGDGAWLQDRRRLQHWADFWEIALVPELYAGPATRSTIDGYLAYASFLGGTAVEGVVIKNYGQTVQLGSVPMPLFTKLVRPEFKEQHAREWGTPKPGKSAAEALAEAFCPVARWEKAVQHGVEAGLLQGALQDIPVLMRLVSQDVEEECAADLKEALWQLYRKDVLRQAVKRLPEWYKARLLRPETWGFAPDCPLRGPG